MRKESRQVDPSWTKLSRGARDELPRPSRADPGRLTLTRSLGWMGEGGGT